MYTIQTCGNETGLGMELVGTERKRDRDGIPAKFYLRRVPLPGGGPSDFEFLHSLLATTS